MATPLLAVLVVVEVTDIIFAVDSIPAIFAVTQEPFLVFASNAFAILGLRAMYFLLADLMHRFVYLKLGLSFVLVWVGIKMIVSHAFVTIPTLLSLGVVVAIIATSVVASLLATRSPGRGGVGRRRRRPMSRQTLAGAVAPTAASPALGRGGGRGRRLRRRRAALLVLPGPGIALLIAGLVILATEFAWAESLLRRVKQHGTAITINGVRPTRSQEKECTMTTITHHWSNRDDRTRRAIQVALSSRGTVRALLAERAADIRYRRLAELVPLLVEQERDERHVAEYEHLLAQADRLGCLPGLGGDPRTRSPLTFDGRIALGMRVQVRADRRLDGHGSDRCTRAKRPRR